MVRNGVALRVTAWFAATITPSAGSSAHGISENSTKPCQSYVESQPGAGQYPAGARGRAGRRNGTCPGAW